MHSWTTGGQQAGGGQAEASFRQGRGIVDLLLVLGVIALLTLSDFALESFGIPYNSEGGSILSKIHPATYLFSVALGLAVLANRNPFGYLASLLIRCPGSTFLLASCLLLWVFISRYKVGNPSSFLIDTVGGAAIIFLLFADASERTLTTVARVVHVIMFANCLLSVVEGLSGWRLFPFVLSGREQTWEYRATALLGHPLAGALITGVYAVILMTVKDVRGLGKKWRMPLVIACLVALPFIGSRTSFVLVSAVATTIVGLKMLGFLRGGTISVRSLLALMAVALIGTMGLSALIQMGAFENFIERFMSDKGSAESRVLLFKLFDDFTLEDLLVGKTLSNLDMNVRSSGLTEGIENSWAGHLLNYGLVMSTVLWFGIAAWFSDLLRLGGYRMVLPLAYVFLIISTTVGISGKTTMLVIPEILMLALITRAPHTQDAPLKSDLISRIGTRPRNAATARTGKESITF